MGKGSRVRWGERDREGASTNYQNSCKATAATGLLAVLLVFMVNYENRCEIKLRTCSQGWRGCSRSERGLLNGDDQFKYVAVVVGVRVRAPDPRELAK